MTPACGINDPYAPASPGSFSGMSGHTVAIAFVRSAIESAELHGLDVRTALREAGITAELIGEDRTRVTPAQATRLVQVLWDATDDELLGVGTRPIPRGTFRMIALGLIHSPDLRTVLERFVEFARIAMGVEAMEMVNDGHITRVSVDPGGRSSNNQLIVDIAMAITHRFAAWLIGKQLPLDSVDLPYPAPPHASEYLLIYGIAPHFDSSRAAFAFNSRYLTAPVVRDEDELLEFIRNSPADLLFRRDYSPTPASRVRKILERGKRSERQTAEEVASRLVVSPAYLRRLLGEEGTSFRQIQQDVLRDKAIESLVRGTETVEEISDRLGFSEPSAFRRAFRRWTGSPPGSYRPVLPANRVPETHA